MRKKISISDEVNESRSVKQSVRVSAIHGADKESVQPSGWVLTSKLAAFPISRGKVAEWGWVWCE